MSPRIRKAVAVVSATALVGSAGLGAANAATSGSDSQSTSSSDTRPAGPGHGPGGKRRGMPTATIAKIAKALGVSTADLKAAIKSSRPDKPAKGDGRGDFAATLADLLGADTSKIREILDANGPAQSSSKPKRGSKPDHSKLIAALADGLGIDEAEVQAAFDDLDSKRDADRSAREATFYAAVAKALKVDDAKVKAAFEANRPAKPAGR